MTRMDAIMDSNACSVPTCVKDPNHICFLLPKDHFRAILWMDRCGIKQNYVGKTMICEAHFPKNMFSRIGHPKRLKRHADPTLNLPPIKIKPRIPDGNTILENEILSNTIANIDTPLSEPKPTDSSIIDLKTYSNTVEIHPMENELFSTKINFDDGNNDSVVIEQPTATVNQIFDMSAFNNIEKGHSETSDVELSHSKPSSSSTEVKCLTGHEVKTKDLFITKNDLKHLTRHAIVTLDIPPINSKNSRGAISTTQVEPLADTDYTTRTIIELKKKIQFISEHLGMLKTIAVKIYLKCPQGYEMLHKTLQLPPVSELKTVFDDSPITTDKETLFAKILQYKSEIMSFEQKYCVLCIGTIEVRNNLYYDIKRDKLIGVCDINNIQKTESAYKVLVVSVQGIYSDWKQPIDIVYLSTPHDDNLTCIDQWIERSISNMLKLGFKVCALVCEPDVVMASLPYHKTYRKIYYIYDIRSLLKCFFHLFLTHDYIFEGKRAKIQHIIEYIKLDSKNQPRLSPKLTEEILQSGSIQDVNVKDVKEIMRMETAAAITAYIDLQALQPAARNTVEMITKMSMLLEVLYSTKCDNASKETYLRVLYDMISFFKGLKIVNSKTEDEVAAEDTFVPKFLLTIQALLLLYKDMQSNNKAKALSLQRLSLENMTLFFDRVKQLKRDNTKPTCKKIYLAYKQSALINILKSTRDKRPVTNLEDNLRDISDIVFKFKSQSSKEISLSADLPIRSSEYNTLDFKNKEAIVLLAGFILKKCYDCHYCHEMKTYVFIVLQDKSSICKTILKDIQERVCVVPQESFIEFVEMMEIRFRSFISKDILESQDGLINGLLKAMEAVTFRVPCSCFPLRYAKKLYLRIRIYNMLKFNNNCFTAFPEQHKRLVVNNL